MSVRILAGRAGRLQPLILQEIAQARQAGQRIFLLVPEQFTLLMEREIMDSLHLPGMLDLDVISPSRLRRSVFDRGGQPRQSLLDDRGRRMALSRALMANREKLQYYEAAADTVGLPAEAVCDSQRHEKGGSYGGDAGRACTDPACGSG